MIEADTQSERKKSRIPKFANLVEEAEFWDTHDITDYMDELTPVEFKFSETLANGIVVRFTSDTLTKVYETAREQGITMDALIQQWVVERLEKGSGFTSSVASHSGDAPCQM